MSERMRHIIGAAALILGLAALYVILILTAVHIVGTDADLYYREQTKAGILPAAGITDEALRALDGRLAVLCSGEIDDAFMEALVAQVRQAETQPPTIVALAVTGSKATLLVN